MAESNSESDLTQESDQVSPVPDPISESNASSEPKSLTSNHSSPDDTPDQPLPQMDPDPNPLQLARQAYEAYKEGRFKDSLELLEQAFPGNTDNPSFLMNRSLVKFLMKKEGVRDLKELTYSLEAIVLKRGNAKDDHEKEEEEEEEMEEEIFLQFKYNLCLTYFLSREYLKALSVAGWIPNSPSIGNSERSTQFQHQVLLLKTYLALLTDTPAVAWEHTLNLSQKLQDNPHIAIAKARALLLMKKFKSFKEEFGQPIPYLNERQNITLEFLRAHAEFLKGNYRKGLKMISNSGQLMKSEKGFPKLITSCFNNNSGCISLLMKKYNLAKIHFLRATRFGMDALKDPEIQNRLDINHQRFLYHIVFNRGISELHSGDPEAALKLFLHALPLYGKSSRIWLHMAECCIMDAMKKNQKFDLPSSSEVTFNHKPDHKMSVIGSGEHRKYVLPSTQASENYRNDQDRMNLTQPTLTLAHGKFFIENALSLFMLEERVKKREDEHYCPNSRSYCFHATMLLKHAYISLCLSDYYVALSSSNEIIHDIPNLPTGYTIFAKLYAAECLIFLDRITEALELLNPALATDVKFDRVVKDEDGNANVQGKNESIMNVTEVKEMFHVNMAIAHLIRGSMDKAEKLLNRNFKLKHPQLKSSFVLAKLYLLVKSNRFNESREFIRLHANLPQNK